MSLIIDALKKAQELRSKDSKGGSFLRNAYPKNRKRPMGLGKRWGLIGLLLFGTLFFLFLILRPLSPPTSPPTPQAIASLKKEELASLKEVTVSEISREALSRNSSEESKGQINLIKSKEKDGRPIIHFQPLMEKPVSKTSFKKERPEQNLFSTPLPSLKEEVSANPIKVEGEEKKQNLLSSEVLNHFNLGVSYQNQKDYFKAIGAYKKAIELDPAYTEAYNNLGLLYQEIGDDNNAFEIFQKLIKINPQYEKAYNNLGILLYQNGRYEEALEAFQKAIAINPNNIESYINLGVLSKKQGQWAKAVEFYQKALSINPLHKETHYNIGLLYEQMEQIDLAIEHYQKFVQLASNTHQELVLRVQRHLNTLINIKAEK